jgi:hypothetical protein
MTNDLRPFLLHWGITSMALWVASHVLSGIRFAGFYIPACYGSAARVCQRRGQAAAHCADPSEISMLQMLCVVLANFSLNLKP